MKLMFQNNKAILITCVFFSILYSSISFVNHYFFRTYALDLGLYTNAIYDYAHFHFNDSQVMQAQAENLLSDHFDLFLILISPLYYIFYSYTLLVVQIIAIVFGGFGIYKFTLFLIENKTTALLATICFFSFFGIFSAIAFDYHSHVIAAMLVPWFFLFFFQEKWRRCSMVFLLILITKENMSLWFAFIALGLIVHFIGNASKMKMALMYSIISVLWFILVVNFIMPSISLEGKYAHLDYSILGGDFSEVLHNIITKPFYAFKLLFINHSGNIKGDWVKVELHMFLLLSGGILLLLKPQFLIMLLPIYFQKLFHDNMGMWGISNQYSVEFAPILILGSVCVVKSLENQAIRKSIMVTTLLLTIAVTIRSFDKTYSYFDRTKQRIYQPMHWMRNFDFTQTHDALKLIPPEASVSAQSTFVPHLAGREHIYQYPIHSDVDYIILNLNENPYPITTTEYKQKLVGILCSKKWSVLYKQPPVILFKRID